MVTNGGRRKMIYQRGEREPHKAIGSHPSDQEKEGTKKIRFTFHLPKDYRKGYSQITLIESKAQTIQEEVKRPKRGGRKSVKQYRRGRVGG